VSVISLKHHLKRGIELPAFLGIKGDFDPDLGFEIGTRLMRFSDGLLLIDLKNVLNYWKWSAGTEEILPFFESFLKKVFGDQKFCFAHHPFQCVLMLEDQKEDFTCLGTPQGDQYYRHQSFEHWHKLLWQLRAHLPAKDQSEYGRMIGRFERFVERMKITRPFELSSLKQDSLERRFGKWLGRVWHWSFTGFRSGTLEATQGDLFQTNFDSFDTSFPWHEIEKGELPEVTRFLDYPLLEWDQFLDFMKEDLLKLLKNHPELKHKKVSRVDWEVSLESLEVHSCKIVFRNPHSLTADAPEFETFLFQAYYSYLEMMKKVESREEDLDYPLRMATVGWKLIISESLRLSPKNEDLLTGGVSSLRLEMENKLPLSLDHYALKASFFPETSFGKSNEDYLGEKLPWLMASKRKPLFIFNKIEPLVLEGNYKRTFLERVASLWWGGSDPHLGDRDYYLIEDKEGLMWWAFQDPRGGWFKHGLFS
jgi:hypothetical protein